MDIISFKERKNNEVFDGEILEKTENGIVSRRFLSSDFDGALKRMKSCFAEDLVDDVNPKNLIFRILKRALDSNEESDITSICYLNINFQVINIMDNLTAAL